MLQSSSNAAAAVASSLPDLLAPFIKREQQQDLFTPFDEEFETKQTQQEEQQLPQKKRVKRAPRKRLTVDQKQAHNKIEKKYRININTKIAKLQQIIPWVSSERTAFEVANAKAKAAKENNDNEENNNNLTNLTNNNNNNNDNIINNTLQHLNVGGCTKLNKSIILEKAVDYILYLQNNERLYEMEVQRLKKEVESLKNKD